MGILQTAIRWYRLNHGGGKRMLEHGAELLPCPHCETETPVFESTYDADGMPGSFSVCLWCDGLIEYDPAVARPHEPYVITDDSRTEEPRSKP